jgi:cytidylate kinase
VKKNKITMKYRGLVISGKPCAGKSVLCKMLNQEYKWEIFSIGGVFRARYKIAHPTEDITFEKYWDREVSDEENMQANIGTRKLMEIKDLVVDARYAAFGCKDLPYLKIFLKARLDVRVERAIKRGDSRSKEELKDILMDRECDEFFTGMKLFKEDYRDPKHYDLVLDNSNLTIEQEFNHIKEHLESSYKP